MNKKNTVVTNALAVFLLFALTLHVEVNYQVFETKNTFDSLLFIPMIS